MVAFVAPTVLLELSQQFLLRQSASILMRKEGSNSRRRDWFRCQKGKPRRRAPWSEDQRSQSQSVPFRLCFPSEPAALIRKLSTLSWRRYLYGHVLPSLKAKPERPKNDADRCGAHAGSPILARPISAPG